jgi:glutathione S-transferase
VDALAGRMPKLTVHHLENSRSLRILWLLEELDLPYEVKEYKRHPVTMRAPPELAQLHPLGKAPAVEVTEDDGSYVLAESGAIIESLVEIGAALSPDRGTVEHRRYRYFMHYAEGSLMAPLLLKLITSKVRGAKMPFFVKPIARGIVDKIDGNFTDAEIDRHFAFLDAELAERPYFAGAAFTAADIQMFYGVEAGRARADKDERPHITAWLDRVRSRDGYKRAVARGGENEIVA